MVEGERVEGKKTGYSEEVMWMREKRERESESESEIESERGLG